MLLPRLTSFAPCTSRSIFLSRAVAVRRRRNEFPPDQHMGHDKRDPVDWIKDATTFSDAHSVVLDPTTKLPYQEKDLREMMDRTAHDAMKDMRRQKFGKKAAVSKLNFDHIPLQDQVVLLFPGQGAQFVGMGKKLSESRRAMAVFERASELLGYDLFDLCTTGPKTKLALLIWAYHPTVGFVPVYGQKEKNAPFARLDQTLYCQPAVVAVSLAAFEALQEREEGIIENCTDAAGFSVGEITALIAGGVLSMDDGIRIVAARAAAMHECSQLIRSGMATVRVVAASRLDEAIVEARKAALEAGEMQVCEVANHLFCGVKVIGASETCMRFLEEHANTFRFEFVKRLPVSGAFHTIQMEGAVSKVMEAVKKAELKPAALNVYSNFTGHVYGAKKAEIRGALAKQVTSPVKWEQIQQLLYRKHRDFVFPRYIECGPGRQLGVMLHATSKKAYKHYEHIDV